MNIQVLQILELLKNPLEKIPTEYKILLYLIGTIFGILNCFMGYRLRKVWGCILGVLAGAGCGAAAGYYFLQDKAMAVLCAAAGAVLVGVLAWLLYRFGVFVLCMGLVYALVDSFFKESSQVQLVVCLLAGLGAGILSLKYEKIMVIAVTAFCGGIGGSHCLLAMTGKEELKGELFLGLIMAVVGMIVQFFTTEREEKKGKRKKRAYRPSGRRRKRAAGKNFKTAKPRKSKRVVYDDPDEYDYDDEYEGYEEAEAPDEEPGQEVKADDEARRRFDDTREYSREEIRSASNPKEYFKPGIGIDLDDLNRELSQEIKKIYEDENQ